MASVKRARVDVPRSYKDLDVASAGLRVLQSKSDKMYIAHFNNEEVRVLLNPDEPFHIVFGFDLKGQYEQRSFNCSNTKALGNESLSIRVQPSADQNEFFSAVEKRFQECFDAEGEEEYEWVPLLMVSDKHDNTTMKITVCLAGEPAALTTIKIKGDEGVEQGKGWEFLKEQAACQKTGSYAFSGGEAKVVAKLRPWSLVGKSGRVKKGLTFAASQLFIKPMPWQPNEEADVLEEW